MEIWVDNPRTNPTFSM